MTLDLFSEIGFFALAAVIIIAALLTIFLSNIIYAGLSLLLVAVGLSLIYIWSGQEYLGAMQLIIYAGAIMVLILFMIMLLNTRTDRDVFKFNIYSILAIVCGALFFAVMAFVAYHFKGGLPAGDYTLEAIAKDGSSLLFANELYKKLILAIELVAVFLLLGILAAVMLTKKDYNPN